MESVKTRYDGGEKSEQGGQDRTGHGWAHAGGKCWKLKERRRKRVQGWKSRV